MAKKKSRTPKKRKRSLLWKILIFLFLSGAILSVVLTGYCFHLSMGIEERFSGRRWSVPSTAYSDVTLLYPGRGIDTESFVRKLGRMGYTKTNADPEKKGEWRKLDDSFEIFLHDLDIPGEKKPGEKYVINISGGRIRDIKNKAIGKSEDVVELEPEEIMQFFGKNMERRDLVSISEIPENLIKALMAAEDSRFYSHFGIDPIGLARAFTVNIKSGSIAQGGSTLTQQLAKNYFLTPERTLRRKINEFLIALAIEMKYKKEEIIEIYLNEIYFGQKGTASVNGIGEAAAFYFDKKPKDLSLAECASLAGMIRSPNNLSPFKNPEKCRARRDQVLGAMLAKGWISKDIHDTAVTAPLSPATYVAYKNKAPYFMDYVSSELSNLYPSSVLTSMGYSIYTTLDTDVQAAAETALENGLARLEKEDPSLMRKDPSQKLQGAVIVMQPRTGKILAMAGGRNHEESQFNRITRAKRQPGSCFKPFVAARALEKFNASDLFSSAKKGYVVNGKTWTPENYSKGPEKLMSMREMLAESNNRAAVDVAVKTGLESVAAMAKSFRFTTDIKPYSSMALGSFEVIPLELATAYCAFAADGIEPYPLSVAKVRDESGNTIMGRHVDMNPVISPEHAFIITSMLEDVVTKGTAKSLKNHGINFPVAGKTGTTSDYRDAWFIGYTPDFLALVWVGFDGNDPVKFSGGHAAVPIWADLAKKIPGQVSGASFSPPPGIRSQTICRQSGKLAGSLCRDKVTEYYDEGNVPSSYCDIHSASGTVEGFFEKLKGIFN